MYGASRFAQASMTDLLTSNQHQTESVSLLKQKSYLNGKQAINPLVPVGRESGLGQGIISRNYVPSTLKSK